MGFEALKPGQMVGDYKLVRSIGAGGFGEVWLAEHEVLQARPVAMKFPNAEGAIAALRREGEIQHALEHPGIVKIIGLSLRHSPPYIVMDYIDGTNLEDRLRDQPLSLDEARAIFGQVLEALEFAHARSVVHYDLKPSNILLDKKGRALISDFGLSAVLNTQELLLSGGMTQTFGQGGSLDYMAPERKKGLGGDRYSDIYAIGVMLYRALTLRLPDGLELPSELRPDLPPGVDAVIKKALHPDPSQRYASAQALQRALDAALRGKVSGPPLRGEVVKVVVREKSEEGWSEQVQYEPKPPARARRWPWLLLLLTLLAGWVDYSFRPLGRYTLLGRFGAPTLEEKAAALVPKVHASQRQLILLPAVDITKGEPTPLTREVDAAIEAVVRGREGVEYYTSTVGAYAQRMGLPEQGFVSSYIEVDPERGQLYAFVLGDDAEVWSAASTDRRLRDLAVWLRSEMEGKVFFLGVEELGTGLRNVRTRALELALASHLATSPLRWKPDLREQLGQGFTLDDLADAARRAALQQKLGCGHAMLGTLSGGTLSVRIYDLGTGTSSKTHYAEVGELEGGRLAGARRLSLSPKAIVDYSQLVDKDVEGLLAETMLALHAVELDRARAKIEQLAARDGVYRAHAGLAFCRGLVAEAEGDEASAVTLYELAVEAGMADPELARRLGNLYLRQAQILFDKGHKCLWTDDAEGLEQVIALAERTLALEHLPDSLRADAEALITLSE